MNSARLALTILRETASRLLANWEAALRICALPLIVPMLLLSAWLAWSVQSGSFQRYLPTQAGGEGVFPVFAIILILIAVIGTYPVAVRWHRFELKGEEPRLFETRFHFSASLGYFGRTILLMLWTALCAFFLLLPMFVLADRLGGAFQFSMGEMPSPPTTKNFLLASVYFALLNAAFFRFAMILPARALGLNMTFGESKDGLKKTGFATLLWLGLFFHLAPLALNRLIGELGLGVIGTILLLPFILLFWLMFGVAVLTRLYDRAGLPLQPVSTALSTPTYPPGPPPTP